MTISIRPAAAADASAIAAIYGTSVSEGYASFETDSPTPTEMERRMAARPRLPWLVAERDAQVAGFAYAARHRERAAYRWSADVSVYLAAQATGQGIGSALYAELLPAVTALGYVSAFAGIALPNPASVALHEAMGFLPVGVYRDVGFKHGQWRDVGWWQLRLVNPLPAEPADPRDWQPD
jgi:L-amino acid N-acyltransferase YncA